jgi:hypothetical protein
MLGVIEFSFTRLLTLFTNLCGMCLSVTTPLTVPPATWLLWTFALRADMYGTTRTT